MSNMKPLMIVAEFSLPLGVLAVTVTMTVNVTVTCDCDWSPATVTGTPKVGSRSMVELMACIPGPIPSNHPAPTPLFPIRQHNHSAAQFGPNCTPPHSRRRTAAAQPPRAARHRVLAPAKRGCAACSGNKPYLH